MYSKENLTVNTAWIYKICIFTLIQIYIFEVHNQLCKLATMTTVYDS